MIPLHPEATHDPRTIRWVMPVGTLGFVGVPRAVPAALAALLSDGTLSAVEVEPTGVLTTSAGQWRAIGPRVRSVLAEALADPAGWTGPEHPTSLLAAAVEEVIATEVGDYVRSHGGVARLLSVEGSVATIALEGACSACPARGMTLEQHFTEAVAARYPGAEVRLRETGGPLARLGLIHRH